MSRLAATSSSTPFSGAVVGREVPRGVVRPLRGQHHRQPRHLDDARVVGADRLALDDRHARDAERLADGGRAARPEPPPLAALAQRVADRVHPARVPERALARLHQHPDRAAELDRVDAEIVGLEVQPGELVGVLEPAVRAEEPDRLVLDRRDDLVAVRVRVDVAALDDAAGHAGVGLLAAAGEVLLAEEVPAETERGVVGVDGAPAAEVPDRESADVVGVVRDHRRAGLLEGLDRGLGVEELPVLLDRAHDLLPVVQRGHPVEIDDDRLDLLDAHDRADAAARGEPRRAEIGVAERDARQEPAVLADRSAEREADLLPETLVQLRRRREVALPQVVGRVVEVDAAALLDVDQRPVARRPVEGQARRCRAGRARTRTCPHRSIP